MCERLTFYSVGANIALFGTSVLKYSSSNSADIANIFSGVVFLMPVVGGLISDAWLGKFKTILCASFIYVIGLIFLPASAIDYPSLFDAETDLTLSARRGLFLTGLGFVALGTGGIKANVGPFGAQQLLEYGEPAIKSFFNWFYWFINVGSLIAYTGVAYIQQNISFAWGFFVPLISMVVTIFIFIAGRNLYIHKPPEGSVLSQSLAVLGYVMCGAPASREPGEKKRVFDKAKTRYGGKFDDETVESVKAVLRIMPIFATNIMYWSIYNQMSTTFLFQAERLDVRVNDVKIPASGLNSFNTIIIIILIPIVDRLFYPCMARLGRPLTHLQRIGIGFILASLSVVVAGVIEIYRKKHMEEPGGIVEQELGGQSFNASTITVFVQIPEYALVGASEVFASICGIEFAYTQAPKSMQGLLTGLFYVSSGLGGFVATGILEAVQAATKDYPWFNDEINNAHTEYYFFLLAGLMFLDFLIFLVIAYFYRYRSTKYDNLNLDAVENGEQTETTSNGVVNLVFEKTEF